jgi:predicted DNA-binding transcriptional regulator YafY
MPKNKDALMRFRIINNCLLNGKIKTREEILEAMYQTLGKKVSVRTLAGDIKAMREDTELGYLAPIRCDKKQNNGYYYTDKNYSIDNLPLSKDEIDALSFAAALLEQYKRIGIFGKFTGAVEKIVDVVKIRRNMAAEQFEQYVEFESAPLIKGSEFIEPLLLSIKNKNVLQIVYQSFSSNHPKHYTLHPFFLKEYRNRWYLTGLDEEKQGITTLGLERILEATVNPNLFYTNQPFCPKTYFGNIIGVSVFNQSNVPEKIVIHFDPQQAQYIKTQPLHSSQQILEENSEGTKVQYLLCPNYELKSYLLSLGKACKVLQPQSLQDELARMATEILALYQPAAVSE